jgi:hypothetical protein
MGHAQGVEMAGKSLPTPEVAESGPARRAAASAAPNQHHHPTATTDRQTTRPSTHTQGGSMPGPIRRSSGMESGTTVFSADVVVELH